MHYLYYVKYFFPATTLDKKPLTSLSSLRTTNQTEENGRNNYTKTNTNQTESKQMHLDNFKIGFYQEQSELIEPIDLTNKDKIYAVQSSKTYSSVTTGDSSTIQNKSMVNCDKINPKDQNNKETESSVSENQKLTNESNLFVISRPLFGENFLTLLKKIYSDFEKQQMLLDTMRLAFQQQCIVLKKIIELTDKFNNFNIDDSNSAEEEIRSMEKNEMNINQDVSNKTEEELSREVEMNEENKEEGKSNEDINCNDDTEIKDSEKNNLPKKIRGQARTFTLPNEYDPNNSRWTLKYRKKKKGLVELLPNSRIYIDAIKLNNCKRIAKDSKTLARMLLVEIFSKTALSTCSLTGKKANAYDTDGTCIRPGLDEHARIVLLTYVEQYAIEQKWVKLETQLILGTLRNKLQEMRTKYG